MALTLETHELPEEPTSTEPLIRPFEMVAIGCGVATLIGTFGVSSVLLKAMFIGGSLVTLMGSLLYFGLIGSRNEVDRG